MIYKSTEKGFTLIEVIVTAVLTSVLALGAYSLFNMYIGSTSETMANLKMQRQSEALIDEIAYRARVGAFVLQNGENVLGFAGVFDDAFNNPVGTTGPIAVRDNSNNTLFSFEFGSDGIVRMGEGNAALTPFTVGGDTVRVDIAKSRFELGTGRRQVRVDMVLKTTLHNNKSFTLNIQRGAFICRNNPKTY